MNLRVGQRLDIGNSARAAKGSTRLSALLIAAAISAAICLGATWPRWHTAPPPNPPAQETLAAAEVGASAAPAATSAASGASTPVTVSQPASAKPVAGASAPLPALIDTAPPGDWNQLSAAQREALSPFAAQWPQLSEQQRRKWLAIASVYTRMSPEAQQRLHVRMLRWTQMTPEQRTIARENYEMSRVLPPSARQRAWQAYEALSPAQRAKLAAAERHRRLVVSAPPGGRPTPRIHHAAKPGMAPHPATPPALTMEPLVPLGSTAPDKTAVPPPSEQAAPQAQANTSRAAADLHATERP